MLRFKKGQEPNAFKQERKSGGTWAQTTSKNWHVRLLSEQARLCAYCQRRISSGTNPPMGSDMHVEHWVSQHTGTQTMDWSNVLGVCSGDQRKDTDVAKGERHCDTHRGAFVRGGKHNPALSLHPVIGKGQDPATSLKYDSKGVVTAENDGDTLTLEDIEALNLNATRLTKARQAAYEALVRRLGNTTGSGTRYPLALLESEYARLAHKRWAIGPEQVQVLRYFIRRWAMKLHKKTLKP